MSENYVSSYIGKYAGQADFRTSAQMLKESIFSTLNCHAVGQVLEFNSDNQTATVKICQVKELDGVAYQLPELEGVPVFVYGGNSKYITMGDIVGSYCILVFIDRNIDNFLETGQAYIPETARMHDWSDCIALCGFNPFTNSIKEYDLSSIQIRNNGDVSNSVISVSLNDVSIKSTYENSYSNVRVNGDGVLIENSQGAEILANDKITIKNASQNMAVLVSTLIETIENIIIVNNRVAEQSRSELESVKSKFQELLGGVE